MTSFPWSRMALLACVSAPSAVAKLVIGPSRFKSHLQRPEVWYRLAWMRLPGRIGRVRRGLRNNARSDDDTVLAEELAGRGRLAGYRNNRPGGTGSGWQLTDTRDRLPETSSEPHPGHQGPEGLSSLDPDDNMRKKELGPSTVSRVLVQSRVLLTSNESRPADFALFLFRRTQGLPGLCSRTRGRFLGSMPNSRGRPWSGFSTMFSLSG